MIRKNANHVTLAAIAREAGVAPPTASFILNGKGHERGLAKKTIQRVLEIADQLNYVPNEAARSLRLHGLCERILGNNVPRRCGHP